MIWVRKVGETAQHSDTEWKTVETGSGAGLFFLSEDRPTTSIWFHLFIFSFFFCKSLTLALDYPPSCTRADRINFRVVIGLWAEAFYLTLSLSKGLPIIAFMWRVNWCLKWQEMYYFCLNYLIQARSSPIKSAWHLWCHGRYCMKYSELSTICRWARGLLDGKWLTELRSNYNKDLNDYNLWPSTL